MARTLLHLGGDLLQLPALQWAHQAGLHVALVDPDPAAPGARLAGSSLVAQTDDEEAVASFALELEAERGPVGVHTTRRAWLGVAAAVEAALATRRGEATAHVESMRLALAPQAAARRLSEAGVPIAARDTGLEPPQEEHSRWEVNAFFRDRAFVPAGILERVHDATGAVSHGLMPTGLGAGDEHALHALVERAARALGLDRGPVGAEVQLTQGGPAIVELLPCFRRAETTFLVAPLALGKSPIQAWFAHLVEAGGPFDSMHLTHSAAGAAGAAGTTGVEAEEPCAGWLAIRAERSGVFRRIDGVEEARASLGVAGVSILARPGDELPEPSVLDAPLGYVWGTGWDGSEVEARLRDARARLSVRLAA